MKTLFFENFEAFENANVAGKQELTAIVKNENCNTFCADLETNCKNYKTAIKRFFKSLAEYPQFAEWEECLAESCRTGLFKDFEAGQNGKYDGGWHFTVENNDDNYYICLNVLQ